MLSKLFASTVAAASLLTASVPAHAWGDKGHRLIAAAAWTNLSPQTKAAIAELIGSGEEAFLAASRWADEVRPQRRETAPWHYVNVPLSASGYDAKRDCPTGRCIVAKIPELMRVAADKASAVEQRADALKFVIHLIGDLHQPFHVGDNNDRGGNDTWVKMPDGRMLRLHEFWDVTILEDATYIIQPIERAIGRTFLLDSDSERAGTIAEWTNDSHEIARDFAPALLAARSDGGTRDTPYVLPPEYIDEARRAAHARLYHASMNLGAVLHSMFGSARSTSSEQPLRK